MKKNFLLATKENFGTFGEVVLFAKKTNKGFLWTLSSKNAYKFESHTKAERTAIEMKSRNQIYVIEQA